MAVYSRNLLAWLVFFDLEGGLPLDDMCFSLSCVTTRGCSVRTCLWAGWWVVVKVKLLSKVRKAAKETGIRPSQSKLLYSYKDYCDWASLPSYL